MSGGSEEKTDPASSRKLEKQRKKGSVAQASEASSYVRQALAILFMVLGAKWTLSAITLGFDTSLELMNKPVELVYTEVTGDSLRIYTFIAGPAIIVALMSGLLVTMIYQKGLLFAVDPIIPQFSKLNPAEGLKRIFGMRGWVEMGASLARLAVWMGAFAGLVYFRLDELLAASICGIPCLTDIALSTLVLALVIAVIIFIVFALVDGMVQGFLFAHEQKMTRTEVKQERKDQSGAPETRKARKKFQKELENGPKKLGPGNANMAMFFGDQMIAIRYHPEDQPVPVLMAKGKDAAKSEEVRAYVRSRGYPETESAALVTGLIDKQPGDAIPVELHDALRDAINAMYG